MLSSEKRLAICKTCANIIMHKRPYHRVSKHELQNIGFVSIKSDILRKAHSEAYYSMLHAAFAPKTNKNDPELQKRFISTRRAMGRERAAVKSELYRSGTIYSLDNDSAHYDHTAVLLDIKDAILKLSPENIEIAILYLLEGRTQRDLCTLLHLTQPTISIKIQIIKDHLSRMLKEYDR